MGPTYPRPTAYPHVEYYASSPVHSSEKGRKSGSVAIRTTSVSGLFCDGAGFIPTAPEAFCLDFWYFLCIDIIVRWSGAFDCGTYMIKGKRPTCPPALKNTRQQLLLLHVTNRLSCRPHSLFNQSIHPHTPCSSRLPPFLPPYPPPAAAAAVVRFSTGIGGGASGGATVGPSAEQQTRMTKFVKRLVWYPAVLIVSWTFATINRIQNAVNPNGPIFGLFLLHVSDGCDGREVFAVTVTRCRVRGWLGEGLGVGGSVLRALCVVSGRAAGLS